MVKIGDVALGDFPLLLAPMEDVSDPPFRAVCKVGGVDLMYTEFISSEGLIRNARQSVMKLDIFESERPIGIQIFGSDVESMKAAVGIAGTGESRSDRHQLRLPCQESYLQRSRRRDIARCPENG